MVKGISMKLNPVSTQAQLSCCPNSCFRRAANQKEVVLKSVELFKKNKKNKKSCSR